jgi:endonuclease/exonuclease/phosphatase family metal-dependent hydrolase
MFNGAGERLRRSAGAAVLFMGSMALLGGTATAQQLALNAPRTQVTDTTIRAGAYRTTNYDNQPLITRRSTSDPDWERRAILKFDTQNILPQGTKIASATLTLTVKSGLGSAGQTRPLEALRIVNSWQESEATWVRRQGNEYWSKAGGDTSGVFATANASNTNGARVNFNVTGLVQRTINGEFGSRYTRILLADAGSEAKESYREYYPSEDSVAGRRPTLTIVLATTTTTPPPTSSPSSSTLKVLHWNISQGHDPSGRPNIDRIATYIASKRPDVVSLNEAWKYSSTSSHCQQIADRLRALTGETWRYHFIQKWGASTGEGEAVMTRLDVDATDDYLLSVQRSVAMLRLNVNGRIVHVFSTHLDHQSSSTRLSQVRQLVSWADNHSEQRIIAGDFNSWPGTTEINEMGRTYYDGWAVARAAGTAYSSASNPDGNTRNTRIDYVWSSKGATALRVVRADVWEGTDSLGRMSDHRPLMVTYQVN